MLSKSEIRALETKSRTARTFAAEAAANAAWAFSDGNEARARDELAEVERLARKAGEYLAQARAANEERERELEA